MCKNLSFYAQCPEGSATATENLVQNGDFSLGNNGFESDYIFTLETSCDKNSGLPEGMYSVAPNPKFVHGEFANCGDHTNGTSAMMIVNGSTIPGQVVWKQKIMVQPHTTYYFSTWIANAIAKSPSKLAFSINGKSLGTPIVAPEQACEWKQFFTLWESGIHKEAVISILNQSTVVDGNDFMLDDIVFYTCESINFQDQLQEAGAGSVIQLQKVFFDTGKDLLKQEAYEQLNTLIRYLTQHPGCEIEIGGHTDSLGNKEDNQILSEKRAKAVYDYLLTEGVSQKRLQYKGFGENNPVESNKTLEGRQKNRRVEFRIIKM